MSLISGLNISFQGLRDTEAKLAVSTANVVNADKPGYTRKEYASNYVTTGNVTTPINGAIRSVELDPYLQERLIGDISVHAKSSIESYYLSNYVDRLGTVDGETTLNAHLDDLSAALDLLSVTPEDGSLKTRVVSAAERLAYDLRSLSNAVQEYRLQADQEIGYAVDDINESLTRIDELNERITVANASGDNIADMEDERRVELEKIAEFIDIDYFVNSGNQVRIYASGRTLLGSDPHFLSYTPVSSIDSGVVYPGGFAGIEVDGQDITSVIGGGQLGGLIEVRDTKLVEEQAKLDEFATVLSDTLNTLMNQGASVPPRSEMLGEVEGFAGTDLFSATGSVRIATTDTNGVVNNFVDLDLTTFATVDALILGINGALGGDVTASVTPDGAFQIVANNTGEGVSINELDSSVGGSADGFSSYFGLNGMFNGTGAEDIRVDQYLLDDNDSLATGRLSSDVALAVGDTGVFVGDGSLAKEMNDIMTTGVSFSAAGNFAAKTATLDGYADNIMSNLASRALETRTTLETYELLLDQTRNDLQNLTGVNVDEEMTRVIDLEAKFEAAATMISTIQDLFDELINAVR